MILNDDIQLYSNNCVNILYAVYCTWCTVVVISFHPNPSILQHCPLLVEPVHICIYTCAWNTSGAVPRPRPWYKGKSAQVYVQVWSVTLSLSRCRTKHMLSSGFLSNRHLGFFFLSLFSSFWLLGQPTNEQKSQSWYNVSHWLFLWVTV